MLKKRLFILFILGSAILHGDLLLTETVKPSKPAKILDYDSAVSHTLNFSSNLAIAQNQMEMKQGQLTQAGLYPNPSFEYDLETSQQGWHARQELYSLTQLIVLGGKRENQFRAASNDYYAALSGYDAAKLERLYQLTKNFIQTVAAQELHQIAVEQQENAKEFFDVTQTKFEAGKVSAIEKNKTGLTKSLADLTVRQRKASFETAKKDLALIWTTYHEFDFVTYPFYEISAPLPLEDYLNKLSQQPEIRRAFFKSKAAYHNFRYEKGIPIPDLTFTVGYSYDAGDSGLVAGVSLPLPIWDQNQGNIKRARQEMLKAENENQLLYRALETKLSNAYIEMKRSYQEADEIHHTLLKTANDAYDLALEGYKEGKFDYIDVLEAKRSLFDIQEKYIEALVNYHTKKAEIDYLNTGTSE